jgi:hypothetical protein
LLHEVTPCATSESSSARCATATAAREPPRHEPNDGSPLTHWIACEACEGEGWIIEEVQHCTEQDLDELDAAGALERPGLIIP